jgi:F-type H+-transporting ATPase subunit gamma
MASLRDLKSRITSVKNTKKITRAMKMVAASKMNRAVEAAKAAQPYQETIKRALDRVVAAEKSIKHPLLSVPDNNSDILLIILSSDRGLCGGFNSQIIKHTQREINSLLAEGKNVSVLFFGKKAASGLNTKKVTVVRSVEGKNPKNFTEYSVALCDELVDLLKKNAFERALLLFNNFESLMIQSPITQQILPMKIEKSEESSGDYIYEPGGQQILAELLPMVLNAQLLQAFLETEAGEQSARMQAMDSATRNAGEMIDKLTLKYNRARQAAITKELIEIISGAEAL